MKSQAMVKVWDPLVRSFHWLLVIAFFTAYFTEDDFLTLHVYAGYTVLGLILLRLVWGIVGTRYARFSSFVTRPRVAWHYLKDTLLFRAKRYLGHNPAGAAMIVLLLISLLLTTLTGLAIYGASESAGPLAGWFGNIGVLVVIHVGGVIFESLAHRENLVRAMFNGYKKAEHQTPAD